MKYTFTILLFLLTTASGFSQEYKITLLGKKFLEAGKTGKYRVTVDDKPAYDYVLKAVPVGESKGEVKFKNNGKPVCIVTFGYAKAYELKVLVDGKKVASLTQNLFYSPNPRFILPGDTLSKKQLIAALKKVEIDDPNNYSKISYEFVKLRVSMARDGKVIEVASSSPGDAKMILDLIKGSRVGEVFYLERIEVKVSGTDKVFPIGSERVVISGS